MSNWSDHSKLHFGKLIIADAIGRQIPASLRAEIKNVEHMFDVLLRDHLVAVKRKSDGGCLVFKLPEDKVYDWSPDLPMRLDDEITARLIVFLS